MSVSCDHCGLPVPAGLVEEGAEQQFCCNGCRVAYEVIRGHGLEGYYDIKKRIDAPEEQAHVSGQGAGSDAEVIIAKQRHGPPGTVTVSFNKAYASFYPRTAEEAPF